jgi:drug/metabolite transporter (DMT)-like permease
MGSGPILTAFEWGGALLGLLGAFLLATHSRVSRYGWLAFLAANVAMIAFAVGISAYGLLVQQIGFTCTSLLGIHRAWLRPMHGHVTATADDR